MSAARKLSSAPPPLFTADDSSSPSSGATVVALHPPESSALSGRLAGAVDRMRVLEDDISDVLNEANRALGGLETDGILEAAGFRSPAEFEERVSDSMKA